MNLKARGSAAINNFEGRAVSSIHIHTLITTDFYTEELINEITFVVSHVLNQHCDATKYNFGAVNLKMPSMLV